MVDKEGVILIDDDVVTETVATADDVQLPTPEITVYAVVAFGVMVTFAAALGDVPELAVQTKGPAPDTVKPILCPKQIEEEVGVIATDGGELTVTVPLPTIVVGVFEASSPLTVTEYMVVIMGDTTIV